jgi:hypothetical protein
VQQVQRVLDQLGHLAQPAQQVQPEDKVKLVQQAPGQLEQQDLRDHLVLQDPQVLQAWVLQAPLDEMARPVILALRVLVQQAQLDQLGHLAQQDLQVPQARVLQAPLGHLVLLDHLVLLV